MKALVFRHQVRLCHTPSPDTDKPEQKHKTAHDLMHAPDSVQRGFTGPAGSRIGIVQK